MRALSIVGGAVRTRSSARHRTTPLMPRSAKAGRPYQRVHGADNSVRTNTLRTSSRASPRRAQGRRSRTFRRRCRFTGRSRSTERTRGSKGGHHAGRGRALSGRALAGIGGSTPRRPPVLSPNPSAPVRRDCCLPARSWRARRD
jgi:hypothetical protein